MPARKAPQKPRKAPTKATALLVDLVIDRGPVQVQMKDVPVGGVAKALSSIMAQLQVANDADENFTPILPAVEGGVIPYTDDDWSDESKRVGFR